MATAQVRIYDRDGTTLRETISGLGAAWSHGSGVDASDLSFTGKVIETAIGNDPALFDDALARVYVDNGEGMTAVGTPYVLAPGGGTVIGPAEEAAHEFVPVGKGALMLTSEMLVLHYGGVVNRRGPRDITFGWQHPQYDGAGFYAPTVRTRASLTASDAKFDQPDRWAVDSASWIYDPDGTGGLTLFRSPTFSVPQTRKYYFVATADEEYKVYLHGPGRGGVIIEESAQEDGYLKQRVYSEVLEPGTYRVTAEMSTVNSVGGDGFDAFSMYVAYLQQDPITFSLTDPQPVLVTDSDWRVLRQNKSAARPGMTIGKILRILLQENQTWGVDSASLFTRSFTDDVDSNGVAWASGVERSWPVGTTLAQVLADFSDLADFDVDSSFNLHAYQQRGGTKTHLALKAGAIPATAGMNILELTYQSEPVTATRAVVLTEDKFVEVIDTAAEVGTAGRGVYLESSQSMSTAEGTRLGQRFVDENKTVRTVYTAKVVAVDGCIPFVDFAWGDVITALDRTKANISARVLRISAEQGVDPPVFYTVEYQGV